MKRLDAWIVCAALAAPAAGQDLVAIAWDGGVFHVDAATGTGSKVGDAKGALPFTSNFNSMARSPTGAFYAVVRSGGAAPAFDLVEIAPEDGKGTPKGFDLGIDARGIAFDAAGTLFAVTITELYIVDPASGAVALRGAHGQGAVQGLTFDAGGTLWGWSVVSGLVTIDAQSGAGFDPFPGVGGNDGIQFLALGPDGHVYGGRNALYRVDTTTGAAAPIGGGGYADLRGAEFFSPCASTYGAGCPGTGGFTPSLQLLGCAVAGSNTALFVQHALGNAPGALVLGAGPGASPLPGGCMLLVAPLSPFLVPLSFPGSGPGGGSLVLPGPVPAGLSGLTVAMQVLVADPAGGGGFAASNGLAIHFQ